MQVNFKKNIKKRKQDYEFLQKEVIIYNKLALIRL